MGIMTLPLPNHVTLGKTLSPFVFCSLLSKSWMKIAPISGDEMRKSGKDDAQCLAQRKRWLRGAGDVEGRARTGRMFRAGEQQGQSPGGGRGTGTRVAHAGRKAPRKVDLSCVWVTAQVRWTEPG